jgi:hypothetical protein
MAACYETVSKELSSSLLSRLVGLRVSRPWHGYGQTVFLELGKLRTETYVVSGKKRRRRNGQACLMIDPSWRIEKRLSIQFGSNFSDAQVDKGLATLRGRLLTAASLTTGLPELHVTFDDGRSLRTLADWVKQPRWTILVYDRSLVDLDPVWDGIDVVPALHVRAGRLEMEYDFDDKGVDVRRLARYRFPRGKDRSRSSGRIEQITH